MPLLMVYVFEGEECTCVCAVIYCELVGSPTNGARHCSRKECVMDELMS